MPPKPRNKASFQSAWKANKNIFVQKIKADADNIDMCGVWGGAHRFHFVPI